MPCGKCCACLKRQSDDWYFRMSKELAICDNAYFVTLTYTERSLPRLRGLGTPYLSKDDWHKFSHELHRHEVQKNIRWYAIGEYSPPPQVRPHFHILLLNLPIQYNSMNIVAKKYLEQFWKFGIVDVRPVIPARLRYLANYVVGKQEMDDFLLKRYPPFRRVSKHFGESHIWEAKNFDAYKKRLDTCSAIDMHKCALPRYYVDKIFDEQELEVIKTKKKEALEDARKKLLEKFSQTELHDRLREFNEKYFERHRKQSRYITRLNNE